VDLGPSLRQIQLSGDAPRGFKLAPGQDCRVSGHMAGAGVWEVKSQEVV
jgi:hypothetical protein